MGKYILLRKLGRVLYPFLGYKKEFDKSTLYIIITEKETKLIL